MSESSTTTGSSSNKEKHELKQVIDWKGAWVIGLAGTILVTGVTGPVIAGLGTWAIPAFILTVIAGFLVCLFLAELAAMFPERTGGLPAYAYMAYRRHKRIGHHVGGFTMWAYWLGWSPVIAVNMILIGTYINALVTPFGMDIPAILVAVVLTIILFVIDYEGIEPGEISSAILAALSVIPLTIIAVAPFIFRTDLANWANVWPLTVNGMPIIQFAALALLWQFFFLTSWNALAMEAAACYIAECKDPKRDAPKAMIAEGAFGLFIYTFIPLSFLVILGQEGVAADPYAMFAMIGGPIFGYAGEWIISFMLIAALLLSANNAIMGCSRSLYQMCLDGQTIKLLGQLNRHKVPAVAMAIGVVFNMGLMQLGVPAAIYVVSNMGYLFAFIPVMFGYHKLRNEQPDLPRPFKLPEWTKYIASFLGWFFITIYIFGGLQWDPWLWGLGAVILLLYFPMYWYRTRVEDKKALEAAAQFRYADGGKPIKEGDK